MIRKVVVVAIAINVGPGSRKCTGRLGSEGT